METQVQQGGGGGGGSGGGGGGGGEVRRVHIIYFLSRKGHVEHPHLVRVHHLSRNGGVRLRDVKRWLSELRGKDMPDSFAWSYKRKYKAGYVWQDLLDEDLITPISDNEYVLKGSEIASSTFNNDKYSYGDKDVSTPKKSTPDHEVEGAKEQKTWLNDEKRKNADFPLGVSTKTSFEIEEESSLFGSETSSLTDDSLIKHEKDKLSNRTKQEEENGERDEKENNTGYTAQNKNKKGDNVNNSSTRFKKSSPPTPNSSPSNPSIGKSRSYSGRPSHMFRNWITCGTVDTKESAVIVHNIRGTKPSLGAFSNKENSKKSYKGAICKEEKLGGFERTAARSWLLEQQHGDSGRKSFDERTGSKKSKTDEINDRKTVSSAYKPVNRPKCSQCGRQFKPEKLHTHMKSCRGNESHGKDWFCKSANF